MATVPHYQGILFPERAESLSRYKGYKVFLDFWNPLSAELRTFYEGMALRNETRCFAVYGPQGSGKTLFANRLLDDFRAAQVAMTTGPVEIDDNNLWHRVTSGGGVMHELVERATINTYIYLIEDDKNWVSNAIGWKKDRSGRHCIIIADNAERDYFLQSLLGLSDAEFLVLASTESAIRSAAQRLVALARGQLLGCLFLILTNNELFLLSLDEAVEAQHSGLLKMSVVPSPSSRDKEIVVRVNTNRLNPIYYWFCLDKAGPFEKRSVYHALNGASTFPDSFAAVNKAISTAEASRIGRPAKKNTLSLMLLHEADRIDTAILDSLGKVDRTDFDQDWLTIKTYREAWASMVLSSDREARLLESEWQLRVVALGRNFVASLLRGDGVCSDLLSKLKVIHGPGTWETTRESYSTDLKSTMSLWEDSSSIDLDQFWQKGQSRSHDYESRLREILPGYDTGGETFLEHRPDYIINPFRPCSILVASSDDGNAINAAIRRDAHVYEFVAIKEPTVLSMRLYLKDKLKNYVSITQE